MASDPPPKIRVPSIDALRGLVMILMALDHTRDFFHFSAQHFQPEDLARTTTAIFLTRWITHFCAPVFMFTAGLAAYLQLTRGKSRQELSAFLWKRGLWLVALELTVVRFLLTLGRGPVILEVVWALGWSMVILGFLIRLPVPLLTVLSASVIALHNLADSVRGLGPLWNILHQPGTFRVAGVPIHPAYPLVPWFAVMAAGFCFGEIVSFDPPQRRRAMTRIGLGLTVAFIAIRSVDGYGDPTPWSGTALSFLRCLKYPPSLDFLLMTLGPAILVLSLLDRLQFSEGNPLIVFGRVPLFYFLAHLAAIHLLTIPLALARYGRAAFLWTPLPSMGGPAALYPADYGYSLPVVYLLWACVVGAMYPLCVLYGRVKRRGYPWTSYV